MYFEKSTVKQELRIKEGNNFVFEFKLLSLELE